MGGKSCSLVLCVVQKARMPGGKAATDGVGRVQRGSVEEDAHVVEWRVLVC